MALGLVCWTLPAYAETTSVAVMPRLDDHPFRLFLFVDAQHVFHGERLEIQLVRGVVVGGHGFRIAVDHDRLEPSSRMANAAWTQQ